MDDNILPSIPPSLAQELKPIEDFKNIQPIAKSNLSETVSDDDEQIHPVQDSAPQSNATTSEQSQTATPAPTEHMATEKTEDLEGANILGEEESSFNLFEGQPVPKLDSAESADPKESQQTAVDKKAKEDLSTKSDEDAEASVEKEKHHVEVKKPIRPTRSRRSNTKYTEEEDPEEVLKGDSLFNPEEDEEFFGESPDDGSEDEYVVGRAKKKKSVRRPSKGAGRGRKKSVSKKASTQKTTSKSTAKTKRPVRSVSQTSPSFRPSRRASRTIYYEDSSDDDVAAEQDNDVDYIETFNDNVPSSKTAGRRRSPVKVERENTNSRPRRSVASRLQSYDESLNSDASDDEEMIIRDGQPQLKSKKNTALSRYNNRVQVVKNRKVSATEFIFMVKKEHHSALKSFLSDKEVLDSEKPLFIWKKEGQLLQKFVLEEGTKKFKSTTNYLGYFEGSEKDYVIIEVNSVLKDKLCETVELAFDCVNGRDNVPESDKIKNSIEKGMANKATKPSTKAPQKDDAYTPEPVRKRGRPRKSSDTAPAANVKKRKVSLEGDTAPTPRKRGRPKKNSLSAEAEQSDLAMEVSDSLYEELSAEFIEYVKVLLTACSENQKLNSITDSETKKLAFIDNKIDKLAEEVLKTVNLKEDFANDLKSLPGFLKESIEEGHACQVTIGESSPAATKNVTLSAKGCTEENSVEKTKTYFVSEAIGDCSWYLHKLYHFKPALYEKCEHKLKKCVANIGTTSTALLSENKVRFKTAEKEPSQTPNTQAADVPPNTGSSNDAPATASTVSQCNDPSTNGVHSVTTTNAMPTVTAAAAGGVPAGEPIGCEPTVASTNGLPVTAPSNGQSAGDPSSEVGALFNDILQQVVQSCIGDLPAKKEGVEAMDTSKTTLMSGVEKCLNDRTWVEQLLGELTDIIGQTEAYLKKHTPESSSA